MGSYITAPRLGPNLVLGSCLEALNSPMLVLQEPLPSAEKLTVSVWGAATARHLETNMAIVLFSCGVISHILTHLPFAIQAYPCSAASHHRRALLHVGQSSIGCFGGFVDASAPTIQSRDRRGAVWEGMKHSVSKKGGDARVGIGDASRGKTSFLVDVELEVAARTRDASMSWIRSWPSAVHAAKKDGVTSITR